MGMVREMEQGMGMEKELGMVVDGEMVVEVGQGMGADLEMGQAVGAEKVQEMVVEMDTYKAVL